jgi:catechol 2,3-dioxygenase-like lactoylglutathione lyase family enzyme
MTTPPVLRSVDAITIPVPGLDEGLAFYQDRLGHRLLWRNDAVGQAGLALPDSSVEVVLTTRQQMEPNWLVESMETQTRHRHDAGPPGARARNRCVAGCDQAGGSDGGEFCESWLPCDSDKVARVLERGERGRAEGVDPPNKYRTAHRYLAERPMARNESSCKQPCKSRRVGRPSWFAATAKVPLRRPIPRTNRPWMLKIALGSQTSRCSHSMCAALPCN